MQPAAALHKVHKSALCIIPPLHLAAGVQRARCFRDKSFVRWPPHINLLYPFAEDDAAGAAFAQAADTAAAALAGIHPFKVCLRMCARMLAVLGVFSQHAHAALACCRRCPCSATCSCSCRP